MGRYYPAPPNIDHTVRYAEDQRRHISAEDIDPYVDPSGYPSRPGPDSWEAGPIHHAQGDYFTHRGNEHPQPFIARDCWVPGGIPSSLRTFRCTDDTILTRKPGSRLDQAASPMSPQPYPHRNPTMPTPGSLACFPQPLLAQYPPPQGRYEETTPYSCTPTPGLTPGWDIDSAYSSAPHTPMPSYDMPTPEHSLRKHRAWTTGDARVPEHIYTLQSYR
jgi:hypothetical protein